MLPNILWYTIIFLNFDYLNERYLAVYIIISDLYGYLNLKMSYKFNIW